MKKLIYCSKCGKENNFSFIDGEKRYHCKYCKSIHYQNPKPTATLICPKKNEILLVQRAFSPGKGEWGLPGGFLELGETLEQGAKRELNEETNLNGKYIKHIISDRFLIPGRYNFSIDMRGLSTGLYFLELSIDQLTLANQILYLK